MSDKEHTKKRITKWAVYRDKHLARYQKSYPNMKRMEVVKLLKQSFNSLPSFITKPNSKDSENSLDLLWDPIVSTTPNVTLHENSTSGDIILGMEQGINLSLKRSCSFDEVSYRKAFKMLEGNVPKPMKYKVRSKNRDSGVIQDGLVEHCEVVVDSPKINGHTNVSTIHKNGCDKNVSTITNQSHETTTDSKLLTNYYLFEKQLFESCGIKFENLIATQIEQTCMDPIYNKFLEETLFL
ncbi:hypothetical protein BC833DRAFT_648101 [Globomyces pollinis-pini]|nr:hypothetical protein BC833DRAFT_648101 [Globomyces pollinis-pini]